MDSLNRILVHFALTAIIIIKPGCNGSSSSGRESKKWQNSTLITNVSHSPNELNQVNNSANSINCGLKAGKFFTVKRWWMGIPFGWKMIVPELKYYHHR